MTEMILTPPCWYLALAAMVSVFYAAAAFKIFHTPKQKEHWTWWVHQVWFNFLGSLSGWIALWLMYTRATQASGLDTWTLVLFFLAFIGITGHMPQTIVGLVAAPGKVFEKLVGQ